MILIIDNYDSFTYNLAAYFGTLGEEVVVRLSDGIDFRGCLEMDPDAIVVSPGPGRPEDALLSLELFGQAEGQIPILGVCLGHQAYALTLGAEVREGTRPMHGKVSTIRHDGKGIYRGLPEELEVMRYHSLIVDDDLFRNGRYGDAVVTATTSDGVIMGLRDERKRIETVQFHPESVGSKYGLDMIRNFLYDIHHHL